MEEIKDDSNGCDPSKRRSYDPMQPYLHLDGQGVNGLILWIVDDAIFGFDLNLIDGGYSPSSYLLILTSRANRKNCVLSRMQTFFAVFFFWGKGPCDM